MTTINTAPPAEQTAPAPGPALAAELAALREEAYESTGLDLLAIPDAAKRRDSAANYATHAAADLDEARAARDRAIVELWAFSGLNRYRLRAAAPLTDRNLHLIKIKALGTKTVPLQATARATDYPRVRALLTERGYQEREGNADLLARSLREVEVATGRVQAARDVRNYLLALLVTDDGLSHEKAGKVMGMTQTHASKVLAHAHNTADPVGHRDQNWAQRIPALLARAPIAHQDPAAA